MSHSPAGGICKSGDRAQPVGPEGPDIVPERGARSDRDDEAGPWTPTCAPGRPDQGTPPRRWAPPTKATNPNLHQGRPHKPPRTDAQGTASGPPRLHRRPRSAVQGTSMGLRSKCWLVLLTLLVAAPAYARSDVGSSRVGLENRVWGSFPGSAPAPGDLPLQVPETLQATGLASTTIVSGSGLFLQPDPEGFADSVNPYAGFAWDPVNLRDPTGMGSESSIGSGLLRRGVSREEFTELRRKEAIGGAVGLSMAACAYFPTACQRVFQGSLVAALASFKSDDSPGSGAGYIIAAGAFEALGAGLGAFVNRTLAAADRARSAISFEGVASQEVVQSAFNSFAKEASGSVVGPSTKVVRLGEEIIPPTSNGARVYHGNDIPPEEVVRLGGLPEKGGEMDLLKHAQGAGDSGLRGATYQARIGEDQGAAAWGRYVYEIEGAPLWDTHELLRAGNIPHPGGGFITEASNVLPREFEAAIHSRIPMYLIRRIGKVLENGRIVWRRNPSFTGTGGL